MRYSFGLALSCCAAAMLVSLPVEATDVGPDAKNVTQQVRKEVDVNLPSLSPIVDRVMPAVVNISVIMGPGGASPAADQIGRGSDGSSMNELLRRYFEQYGRSPNPGDEAQPETEVIALGSGFVIDPSGYIVTNNHVIANAERITVILQDNSRHRAKLIGHDEKTDLALLKIDARRPLPFVQWGDSSAVKVGDWVVAVGNPFGLGGTVTAGIVSARGRNIDEGPYDNFLQIDAPINRGNSGGPTFNLHGEVVGINTAIFSPSGGSVGIGFAIPANFARLIVDQLKTTGHVERGWLGVSIQSLTPAIAKSFGENPDHPTGALVDEVDPGSPAAKAGLKRGDVITEVNGHAIRDSHDLPRIVALTRVGRTLHITLRRAGKTETEEATVAAMPSPAQLAEASGSTTPPAARVGPFGLALEPLTPDLKQELHAGKSVKGVVVEGFIPGSPAAALGLQPGDIIASVNRQPVTSPEQARTKLADAAEAGNVLLFVYRHGAGEFVGASAQE
jgi:serine protease Do